MGRAADADGRAFWIDELQSGTADEGLPRTIDAFYAELLPSEEFYAA